MKVMSYRHPAGPTADASLSPGALRAENEELESCRQGQD